ncbi:MAG: lysine--tRNA ligase [Candidatus Kerfeldbacteria bacterium]|nr:lysine--tRNA ligase [Candidatus Kerfeldbacteria bacterium]
MVYSQQTYMSRLDEQLAVRLQKRKALEQSGIDCYPGTTERSHTIGELREHFNDLAKHHKPVTVVGRVLQIRAHGGSTFLTIRDGHGDFQIHLSRDSLGKSTYEQWSDTMDIGDFFSFSGALFSTKRGEPTLEATEVRVLTKSMRAIPEQYYGVKDPDLRLRKRYLDLLLNSEIRELFVQKNRFWQTVRTFLVDHGFLEVETPVLETVPGGAETTPFVTTYHALDEEVFLRISLELPLKRLLVGGLERVFEIGRIFRNEGMSPEHLQDYTQMEFYWAYADYHDLQKLIRELFPKLAVAVHGTTQVTARGTKLDFAAEWQTYDYFQLFHEHVGLDLNVASMDELRSRAKTMKLDVEPKAGKGRLIDLLYKKAVRPRLIQPGFLIDPPVEVEPLAKRDPGNPKRVQRLQIMAWGTELGKGFTELNDPVDQRQRFEEQMRLRAAGDAEAQRIDNDYLEALEYGMPPAAGFGMSERLFAVLVDKPIRETVLFPPMRTTTDHSPQTHV